MTAALSERIPISHLIIDDVAPNNGFLSPEFKSYIEGMIEIQDSKVSTRKEAQDILSKYEKVNETHFRPPALSHFDIDI